MRRTISALRTVPLSALVIAAACVDRLPTAPPASLRRDDVGAGPSIVGELPAGRYIVGLAPGAVLGDSVLAAAGARVIDSAAALHAVEVDATNPNALVAAGVRYLHRSFEFALDAQVGDGAPNDPPATSGPATGSDAASAPWYQSGVQWDMQAMKLTSAVYTGSVGGGGALVCIIDSGIDQAHQELRDKVVRDTSFVATAAVPSPAAFDSLGHGSHVSSTITANGVVMASVAPAAKLMAAKVFAATGGTPVVRVANALVWCADNGAHAINMSLGGIRYFAPGTAPTTLADVQLYADAVNYATSRGTVVVVSAGNSNVRLQTPGGTSTQQLTLPAQVPGALVVGATGPLSRVGRWLVDGVLQTLPFPAPRYNPFDVQQVWPGQGVDGKAFYSNYGPNVDVFAPGGRGGVNMSYRYRLVADLTGTRVQQTGSINDNVWAACSSVATQLAASCSANVGGVPGATTTTPAGATDRYLSLAGTSMAAPHVTGLAALLYAELGGTRSPENRARVIGCIKSSADHVGSSAVFGGGRVNAEAALACIRTGASS